MNRHAMPRQMTFRSARSSAIFAALAAVSMLLTGCGSASAPAERPPLEGASIGGDFTLVDKQGKPVRFADFAGKYRIVYFGYSFCPDVCPLDLQKMMQGYNQFAKDQPERARQIQPIFITIDPARDTPAIIGEYTANFGPELLGLTGTQAQVDAAAAAFKVFHSKREGSSPDAYLMDHSRGAYLMGRDGKPLALLAVDKDAASVAADLARWAR